MNRCPTTTSALALAALLCACREPAANPRVEPEQNRIAPARDVVDPSPDAIVERASAPNPRIAIEPIDAATQGDASAEIDATTDASQPLAVARPRPSGPNTPYRLDVGNEEHCDLRLGAQGLSSRCSEGSLTCRQLVTGAFTAAGATDTVWDCERSNQSLRFAVLATARAVVWADEISSEGEEAEGVSGDHCMLTAATAEPIVAGTHPTAALLIRARDCQFNETATSHDYDRLWIWRDGTMNKIAEAEFECQFNSARMGRRIGEGMSSCQGEYIVPNAAGTGVNIVGYRVAVRQRDVGADRLMKGNGHIQRRLTWASLLAVPGDETE